MIINIIISIISIIGIILIYIGLYIRHQNKIFYTNYKIGHKVKFYINEESYYGRIISIDKAGVLIKYPIDNKIWLNINDVYPVYWYNYLKN